MDLHKHKHDKWHFAVDRGGTFTDVIGFSPTGAIEAKKILSHSAHYQDAAMEGIEQILGQRPCRDTVASIKMGSTVATNALLERKGARVCLAVTQGFEDLLQIGYQERPDLFAIKVRKPQNLYECVVGVEERIDVKGDVVKPLQIDRVASQLEDIHHLGVDSLAIVLMHAWKNPEHERQLTEIARKIGFSHISCSSEIAPLVKIVDRGTTTVLDAYLHPIVRRYVEQVRTKTEGIRLQFMQSNGGLVDAALFSGNNAILSGPAGGVIGFSHIVRGLGYDKAIGFDMGGTSTDISRFDGEFARAFAAKISGVRFQADMLEIVTVAAGGGSILHFDGDKMTVGPDSAGSVPGPACYGYGGPLTVTDANLLLGRVIAERFPKVFGESGDQPLQRHAAEAKLAVLARQIHEATGVEMSAVEVAAGFIRIANENMSNATRETSIAQGFNTEEYALFAFGGAAAQHACTIANSLGIATIIIHPLSGLLSAYGIALADVVRSAAQSVLYRFSEENLSQLEPQLTMMRSALCDEILAQGIAPEKISCTAYVDIRPKGVESYETIEWREFAGMKRLFYEKYYDHYGIELNPEKELEIVNIRVKAIGLQHKPEEQRYPCEPKWLDKEQTHELYCGGQFYRVAVFHRSEISPGNLIMGPAIVVDEHSTIVVDPGFQLQMNEYKHFVISLVQKSQSIVSTEKHPVMLEIFHNLFMNVARQMGATLINTAHSTNIKERLDFSCAVFDEKGNLIANAPHVPVHLGAMGETVQAILSTHRDTLAPGDVYLSNDPFAGGSHLPDITVVTPVFYQGKLVFAVACRGHHADIGGITPGSMPPFSKSIAEEGVLLHNFHVVVRGEFREQELIAQLRSGLYPARNIGERLSDLQAQIAANQRGSRELSQIVDHYGLAVVQAYMGYILENAVSATQRALAKILQGSSSLVRKFCDYLDDGTQICVTVSITGDSEGAKATIDFAGTSPQSTGNLNAPRAVTKAAVLYVLRTLIEDNIPLNDGCLVPITLCIPSGSLLNPNKGAAVVGGNVETSQRIVDVLYGALGVVAASQGTMNNFTFGEEGERAFGYYETICGGAGAGLGFNGEHAVHTHMTNTRITDPEILEYRYPEVRLEEFAIRRGSGGKGRFCGGDGVIRRVRFLQKRTVSILSQRRGIAPYGLQGGGFAQTGMNTITDIYGYEKPVPASFSTTLYPGEIFNIYTPGGGGFGVV